MGTETFFAAPTHFFTLRDIFHPFFIKNFNKKRIDS